MFGNELNRLDLRKILARCKEPFEIQRVADGMR